MSMTNFLSPVHQVHEEVGQSKMLHELNEDHKKIKAQLMEALFQFKQAKINKMKL